MNQLLTMLLVLGNSNQIIQNSRVDKALEIINKGQEGSGSEYKDAYITLAGNRKNIEAGGGGSESGNLRGTSQSKDMLDYARKSWEKKYATEFPESRIITENLSTNTVENIVCSENIWAGCEARPDRTIVITNEFHVPRVAKIIEDLAFDLSQFDFINATDNGISKWIIDDEVRYFDNIAEDIESSAMHCDAIEGQCLG